MAGDCLIFTSFSLELIYQFFYSGSELYILFSLLSIILVLLANIIEVLTSLGGNFSDKNCNHFFYLKSLKFNASCDLFFVK